MATGIVKFYKTEKGWGAIASDDLPGSGDAFVHFSAIEGTGYRELAPGDHVDFDFEPAHQDSFRYVATRVRRLPAEQAPTPRPHDHQRSSSPTARPIPASSPRSSGRRRRRPEIENLLVPTDSSERRPDRARTVDVDDLRAPRAILWRALLSGVTAGGLLGALVVLPDSVKAQFAPEPGTAYALTWSALLIAVPIGALVGFMPALLALVVWEWQIAKGPRRARLAGSATAALAVVATAGLFSMVNAAPGDASWTISGLALLAAAALVSFAVAYLSVPTITTRRRRVTPSARSLAGAT